MHESQVNFLAMDDVGNVVIYCINPDGEPMFFLPLFCPSDARLGLILSGKCYFDFRDFFFFFFFFICCPPPSFFLSLCSACTRPSDEWWARAHPQGRLSHRLARALRHAPGLPAAPAKVYKKKKKSKQAE